MPWGPCNTNTPLPNQAITPENDNCPTPLPSPQATTGANGAFTLTSAANGHYLLVIGSDSTSTTGTVQATIHDNVTLNGGAQTLVAPTMPPLPTVTPAAWQTNGDYRIATLDPTTEVPCLAAWNQERQTMYLLAPGTADEWLVESSRNINTARMNGGVPVNSFSVSVWKSLTESMDGNDGGSSCLEGLVAPGIFSGGFPAATTPEAVWFGGYYSPITGLGVAQFPIDPRAFTDPLVQTWL